MNTRIADRKVLLLPAGIAVALALSMLVAAPLSALREDASPLIPEASREIRGFRVSVTRDVGMNRMAGRGAFIDGVVASVVQYYREILQNLTPWHAPPKKAEHTGGPIEAEAVSVPEGIRQGLDQAETEADRRLGAHQIEGARAGVSRDGGFGVRARGVLVRLPADRRSQAARHLMTDEVHEADLRMT